MKSDVGPIYRMHHAIHNNNNIIINMWDIYYIRAYQAVFIYSVPGIYPYTWYSN